MSTYAEDEESVEESQPRECFEIKHGPTAYRHAMGDEEQIILGNHFVPYAVGRENLELAFFNEDRDLRVKLPSRHPFTRRWWRLCIPPRVATCTVYRKQLRSGGVIRQWQGVIESCTIDGNVATFRVPASTNQAGRRLLPTISVSRECPYILYEAGCRISRAAFKITTTVASHDGAKVTVASMGGNFSSWASYGELVHLPSGERMTISEQIGNVCTLQLQISELQDGDPIEVYAGCDHSTTACRDKFNNMQNFGGYPLLPEGNVYLPNGYGIYQSEPSVGS